MQSKILFQSQIGFFFFLNSNAKAFFYSLVDHNFLKNQLPSTAKFRGDITEILCNEKFSKMQRTFFCTYIFNKCRRIDHWEAEFKCAIKAMQGSGFTPTLLKVAYLAKIYRIQKKIRDAMLKISKMKKPFLNS